MCDSSDEDLADDYMIYSNRPEWADLKPLEQDDGDNPIVQIAYSEKFKDVFDYFRAIVASGEKSERALELTKSAATLNTANYTVWQYRREILKALGKSMEEELDYIADVIEDNPKNYQVWHHRRVIVEWTNDPSKELELTENILNLDAKNYHAWQHRQWVIKTYNLYDNELNYIDRLISEDMRNNSAWNQRFFVLKHTGLTPEVVQREISYVINRIRLIKNNESSWNFLRGLLQHEDGSLDQYSGVLDFCEEVYNAGSRSPYLLAFLIDIYCEKAMLIDSDAEENAYHTKVFELCNIMAVTHDIIRAKYWKYVAESFEQRYKARI